MDLFDQINSHKFLLLDRLIQANDTELILYVNEGKIDENTQNEIAFSKGSSLKYNPINTNEFCVKYKITFRNFIVYSVVDENYIEWKENEVFVGNLFREFSKSRF